MLTVKSLNLAPKSLHPFHGELHDRFVKTCNSKKLQEALSEARQVDDDPESRFSCLEVLITIYCGMDCICDAVFRMNQLVLCVTMEVTWYSVKVLVAGHIMSSVSP